MNRYHFAITETKTSPSLVIRDEFIYVNPTGKRTFVTVTVHDVETALLVWDFQVLLTILTLFSHAALWPAN